MKTRRALKIIYFLILLFSSNAISSAQCVPASTAAGSLDTCFDTDGKVSTQITDRRDFGYAVAVQPDGKILVAGTAALNPGQNTVTRGDFSVVRYNPDGSLDTTFDGDGIAVTDTGDFHHDEVRAMALQPDGKIVVVGITNIAFHTDFAVVRFNPNGSLDTSFNFIGRVWTNIQSTSSFDDARSVAIQPDGKIVVAGESKVSSQSALSGAIVRYNPNGSRDTTFDGDGILLVTNVKSLYAVRLQNDGKIVVAGTDNKLAVARLNTDGTTDTTFGTSGVATYTLYNVSDIANALVIEADGKIVAGGSSRVSESKNTICAPLVRFTTSGTLETSSLNCDEFPGETVINSLALQSDGKIVAAGQGWYHQRLGFLILRHTRALTLDRSFNNGAGSVHIGFPGTQTAMTSATGVAIQSDNKIVATGWNLESASEEDTPIYVARINAGPASTPFDFDGDGKADVSVYRQSERKWYVFRSSDSGVTERVFGEASDLPVPADYDGDGKTDFALFHSSLGTGYWSYISSLNGNTGSFTQFSGAISDIPRPSDFNGDGKTDPVMFSPKISYWLRTANGGGGTSNALFGVNGDKPLIGDFDGDGRSDLAIFRPSTGDWWWLSSVDNIGRATHWGISTDIPAPADYDGDGKTDFAVYRPSGGVWYIVNSGNLSYTILNFGLEGDKPVSADYDGDGKADIAVFRPSTGTWYLLRSTAGFAALQFGISTDVPLPNAYLP